MERLPDIEITTTTGPVEAPPSRSVWQRYIVPVLGAIADVAVRDVLPLVVANLSSTKTSVPAEQADPARVAADVATGGRRYRHGQSGRTR